jgi:hypothetical protein
LKDEIESHKNLNKKAKEEKKMRIEMKNKTYDKL